jgi:hypothetical protein
MGPRSARGWVPGVLHAQLLYCVAATGGGDVLPYFREERHDTGWRGQSTYEPDPQSLQIAGWATLRATGRSSRRGARRAMARASSTCRTALRLTMTASSTSPTGRTSAPRSSRPEGESLGRWTGIGGPNDITSGKDGNFYIAGEEDGDKPAYVCVQDANGNVLARMENATSTASASTRAATSTPD